VQDEGSQLVALALAAAPVDGADERWLDLCAGPGGKAALLAGLATQRGARLLAVERQPHRAHLVEQALRGDPSRHRVLVADGRAAIPGEQPFDRVLLDAPCTGLGALRRRPEARWRRRGSEVPTLRVLQADLLRAALSALRPGGLVAYVTCSPHIAETSTVVTDVVRGRADVERIDARPHMSGVPGLGDGPDVQLWPHRHGTDAMYLAMLRRRVA
jgi:16S rRNA (cytosine967-C5)-methyltransferase